MSSPTPTTGSSTPTPPGESNGATSSHADGVKKAKKPNKPSPEEIEAKRAARAAKKEKEAAEKAAKEAKLAAAIATNGKIPNGHLDENGRTLFVPRDWADVTTTAHNTSRKRIKILSWNILAQGLVRRTLFPGSDCLKFKDRSVGLTAEFSSRTGHGWDVGCFQEVDRMDIHGEMLEKDGFGYVYEKGYRQKQHGLLIAWRKHLFGDKEYRTQTIDLDSESVSSPDGPPRKACSRITRNIGLFIALKLNNANAKEASDDKVAGHQSVGVVLATTHLFWHPMHAYERARQSGILVRKLNEFRDQLGEQWRSAPCILAGDFNDQPHSATYHLLTGKKLTQHCLDEIKASTVVHKSIDERREKGDDAPTGFAPGTTEPARDAPREKPTPNGESKEQTNTEEDGEAQKQMNADEQVEDEDEGEGDAEEEEEEGGADDQMLKNCRSATPSDALLTVAELVQLHDISKPRPSSTPASSDDSTSSAASMIDRQAALGSSYAMCYGNVAEPSEEGNFFGSKTRGRERWDDPSWTPETPNCHTGDSKEPMWTIFSSLFSLTLDYIFLLPQTPCEHGQSGGGKNGYPQVTRLLRTHRTETLQPGVPRKGVCASDHIAIGTEIEL